MKDVSMEMAKAIEIIGLNKMYSNGRGISNLNLEVDEGDIFGFLGPNGAGKTTAMKIMVGLMRPDSGEVRIFGKSVQHEFVDAMRYIGCIIETAESYPYLTAEDNLKLFARYYDDVDQARIDECLEITGLIRYKREKARRFSLGMKQRLGVAAALLSRPKLLILDEPLNGLDVEGMLDMRRLIKRLNEESGTTFFISSHLIHDVELTCTRVGIIYAGQLVNVEYTRNILANYASLENYFISEVDRSGRI
jgi:ABC-2 type transport system ATP-binding protein